MVVVSLAAPPNEILFRIFDPVLDIIFPRLLRTGHMWVIQKSHETLSIAVWETHRSEVSHEASSLEEAFFDLNTFSDARVSRVRSQ